MSGEQKWLLLASACGRVRENVGKLLHTNAAASNPAFYQAVSELMV